MKFVKKNKKETFLKLKNLLRKDKCQNMKFNLINWKKLKINFCISLTNENNIS